MQEILIPGRGPKGHPGEVLTHNKPDIHGAPSGVVGLVANSPTTEKISVIYDQYGNGSVQEVKVNGRTIFQTTQNNRNGQDR